MPILTIAIPTYDRNSKLVRTIKALVPQLDGLVNLLIVDNCSPLPVVDVLQAENLLHSNIHVIRNEFNIGMAANIIRCFESCNTEWMWLLGDDDVPKATAISEILEDIRQNADCAFLNYKSPSCSWRNRCTYTVGQEELINNLDSFGNLLFISVGVYNIKRLNGDLRLTYQLSYSIAPHLVYLLSGINKDGKIAFLTRELHDFNLRDTTEAESWSWLSLSLCIPTLFEVPMNISALAKQKFALHIKTHIKSSKQVYEILEQPKYFGMPTENKRFLLRQIYFRSLMGKSINRDLISFLFYDFKLIAKNLVGTKKTDVGLVKDDRI